MNIRKKDLLQIPTKKDLYFFNKIHTQLLMTLFKLIQHSWQGIFL